MKAKEQLNIGKARMKHELEKKRIAKEKAELYGFHRETVAGLDPESALRADEDGDPLSQNSAGSASSYFSGSTQTMGKPHDAEGRQG